MNPIALFTFASELTIGAPTQPAKEQADAGSAFAGVLMDLEDAMLNLEEAPSESQAPSTPEKVDPVFWRMATIRPLSADELPPLKTPPDPEPQYVVVAQSMPTIPSEPVPSPPLALPTFAPLSSVEAEAMPNVDLNDENSVRPGFEPRGLFKDAKASPELAFTETLETDPLDEPASLEAAPERQHERKPLPEGSVPSHAIVKVEQVSPAPIELSPAPSQPSLEPSERSITPEHSLAPTDRSPAPAMPPNIHTIPAPPPEAPTAGEWQPTVEQQPSTHPGAGSETRAVPSRIALDALIRPDSPAKSDVEVEAESPRISLRSTAATADTETGFTNSNDSESREQDANAAQPLPQRHATWENSTPAREHTVVERSGSPLQSTREAAPPRTMHVESQEPPTQPATPLKRIEVRIPDSEGNLVVQVQERKGAVQVTVRTDDARTANDISSNLPELTRSLSQQGFRAETDLSKQNDSQRHQDSPGRREEESNPDQRRRKAPQEDFEEYLW